MAFATPPAQAATTASTAVHSVTVRPNAQLEAAGSTVCGSGYTTIEEARRWTDSRGNPLGDVYTYTNGQTTGPNYQDKPVCAAFFNDIGASRYMKITLCDNYTGDPCTSDAGNYSSYAGPVYQRRGFCGTVTVLMKNGGTTIVSGTIGTSPCD
ncbi:hypothetical protein NGB36_26255 [Streptomyces sp. RB6PN25]|uniref:Secreted protein n=1 Tax=Streptomyces humicola TaxID=2953240 RepID=A0ABT1Q291_9ACTN|nr:hypothetical protein [Streptomyces humicola]MCQ4083994.1 hypothetical protein [Streptomyces humicola]